ncbi:MAG: long-chain fatty acid--CoA ligase [Nitrosomonas sp.]
MQPEKPHDSVDVISVDQAKTLDGLFRERVKRSGEQVAYRYFNKLTEQWDSYTWSHMDRFIARWQGALEQEKLIPGDRVAVMVRNCPEWIMFEQAALGLGLVVVPLYVDDRAENAAYVLDHSEAKILLLEDVQKWRDFLALTPEQKLGIDKVQRIVVLRCADLNLDISKPQVVSVHDWLPAQAGEVKHLDKDPHDLATIVYTSGTSGRPKGVMLSHHNILTNAFASTETVTIYTTDWMLSFLPLSHMFERTSGYYLSIMAGGAIAFNRSIPELQEDLLSIRPTLMISVPRIFERIYAGIRAKLDESSSFARWLFNLAVDVGYQRFEYQQGRACWGLKLLLWPLLKKMIADKVLNKLGGRLRFVISGGAPLSAEVSRIFIGLGLPILQGYGMTESSPVVSVNRPDDNVPASIGLTLPGVQVKLGENDALMIRGSNVMLGYWKNEEATKQAISADGWLNSGDVARIDAQGHIFITGRHKEIIVLSTGEKIPPADMEAAILQESLFDQVMIVGEGRSFLSVLAVLNAHAKEKFFTKYGLDQTLNQNGQKSHTEEVLLDKVTRQTNAFPGYARIRRIAVIDEPWTVDNGFLTPTLKLKRNKVLEKYREVIEQLYNGR